MDDAIAAVGDAAAVATAAVNAIDTCCAGLAALGGSAGPTTGRPGPPLGPTPTLSPSF